MAWNDGVNMIRGRVAELHLLPEVESTGALDPGHVGVEFADGVRHCDDVLIHEKGTNAGVHARNPLGIVLCAGCRLQLGQIPVAVALERVEGPESVELTLPQDLDFRTRPGHEFDVPQVPVESFSSHARLACHL